MSTQRKGFDGGEFVFDDPEEKKEVLSGGDKDDDEEDNDELTCPLLAKQNRRAGRVFSPFSLTRGAAVIFSSGWKKMHKGNKVTSCTCYTVPCFSTTCPVPNAA